MIIFSFSYQSRCGTGPLLHAYIAYIDLNSEVHVAIAFELIGSLRLDYEYEIEYEYKPVTLPEPLFFMLVLGRESSSWDEIGMCCDNVKPENCN